MQDREEQTVQRIIEAAGVIIARDGYTGATTPE
ncbi:TetR/AcrR family transcriptional regulator, partial [Streptomyces sp. SID8455]|nr:TetR/AcrR family transcriptional regulator [Streptomyces sp. SID8455]